MMCDIYIWNEVNTQPIKRQILDGGTTKKVHFGFLTVGLVGGSAGLDFSPSIFIMTFIVMLESCGY